jgi:hypothetical protein
VKKAEEPGARQLPRIHTMQQAVCERRGAAAAFRMADSRGWLAALRDAPRLVERLRLVSLAGPRDVGAHAALVAPDAAHRASLGALWALGERALPEGAAAQTVYPKGGAVLCYDFSSSSEMLPWIRRALAPTNLLTVQERDSPFWNLVQPRPLHAPPARPTMRAPPQPVPPRARLAAGVPTA